MAHHHASHGSNNNQVTRYKPPYPPTTHYPPSLNDKLFTGQRLDSTGLYFYNARYYDPTIGRFIGADTIIPNPANPQSFNRYSYCMNNPLKYNDPSGHIVTFNGINLSDLLQSGDYYGMCRVGSSEEFRTYMTLRESSSVQAAWCHTMETSNDHTINITSRDLGTYRAIMTQKNGGNYEITLTTNKFVRQDSPHQALALMSEISDNVLVTKPGFNSYENWENLIGCIPLMGTAKKAGDIINSWQTFWGIADDLQGNQGKRNWSNLIIDAGLYTGTFFTATTLPFGFALFIKGALERQDNFDAYRILKGGYEFQ